MRKSGIELLRIFALFGVIMIHYWEQAVKYLSDSDINYHVLLFLRSLASPSVDLFLVISGYFMCTSYKRTLGKPLNLILQVSIINEIAYLIKSYYGSEPPINLRHLVSSALPDSYYTTLFVVLYFISPYINKMINGLSKEGWNKLMLISLIIFSIYQTSFDLFSEVIGLEIMGLSTIGAWGGGQNGFNIVNFVLLYLVGAYIRNLQFGLKKSRLLLLSMGCLVAVFLWAEIDTRLTIISGRSAWVYHNPIVILFSAVLFLLFSSFNFKSTFINMAAKSVYTCFLAHCTVITIADVGYYCQQSVWHMLSYYLCFSFACYVVFWVLWYIYDKLSSSFYKKLDIFTLNYKI